jgi:predicted RNase H-like HicB family nuclease
LVLFIKRVQEYFIARVAIKIGRISMSQKVGVVIEKDAHGYCAYCPELEGCQTQGDSLEEVLSNIKEAIELYLETLSEEERNASLSKEILTTTLEVNIA